MNTKLFSVIPGIILISTAGLATAESIHLSNTQMDAVTAGAEGESFSQSSSSSQIALNNGNTVHYSVSAFVQGESAIASATVEMVEVGSPPSIPMELVPFIVSN
ncbi:hypothetical protein [Crenothrix sp.]|uniref:hypothetical protein n=1 Tax=Crenothrix sp. TaxID=3100433 RepID=UPI00374CB6BA